MRIASLDFRISSVELATNGGQASGLTPSIMDAHSYFKENYIPLRTLPSLSGIKEAIVFENCDAVFLEGYYEITDNILRLRDALKIPIYIRAHTNILSTYGKTILDQEKRKKEGIGIVWNNRQCYLAYKDFPNQHYLPNLTNMSLKLEEKAFKDNQYLDVILAGSIRDHKAHIFQIFLFNRYAKMKKKKLRIHMNLPVYDVKQDDIRLSIQELSKQFDFDLINIGWLDRKNFISYMNKHADISAQIAVVESFCGVTADSILSQTPIIASDVIDWAYYESKAKSLIIDENLVKLDEILENKYIIENNKALEEFNNNGLVLWRDFLNV